MNGVSFQWCGDAEIELLVKTRLDFCLDGHPETTPDACRALEAATRRWLGEQLAAQRYWGVVGSVGAEAVCCAGMLLYELPPIAGNLERRVGHVLNFFTYPAWRQRGCGKAMIRFMAEQAKERGIERLVLHATAMGEPLYRDAGFADPHFPYLEQRLGPA